MSLFLIGYRGSGKTSVGAHVAKKLRWDFADSDSIITQACGKTIRELFEEEGEAHFRMLETTAITDLCKWDDTVIALGGGAVMREVNRAMIIQSGFNVIYLHADPQTLYGRIHRDPHTTATRPSLTPLGGTIDEVRALLNRRRPLYRALATHEIDVSSLSIRQVADRIVELLSDGPH